MGIKWVGAKARNFSPGRHFNIADKSFSPSAIIIHDAGFSADRIDEIMNTAPERRLPPYSSCIEHTSTPNRPFSYHYGLFSNGDVHQYVHDTDRAFHAGRVLCAQWKMIHMYPPVNDARGSRRCITPDYYTIGVAVEIQSMEVLEPLASLIADIAFRWKINISNDTVVGHYSICSATSCPGPMRSTMRNLVERATAISVP